MKIRNPFRDLTKFERGLWLVSLAVIALAFALSGFHDVVTFIGSLIGATSLIFYAKGYVLGQFLTIAFCLFYGVISFYQRYYGEMICYLCMSLPMAVAGAIAWLRHPFQKTAEVKVGRLSKRQAVWMFLLAAVVTAAFYFILRALGNAELLLSTVSIATSFIPACLTCFRSPYYALGYAVNDMVLVVLWSLAARNDISSLPMVACFATFLCNDLYAFYNWRRMKQRQMQAGS